MDFAIHPKRSDRLITSLITAVDNERTLDKEATHTYITILVAMKFYRFEQ